MKIRRFKLLAILLAIPVLLTALIAVGLSVSSAASEKQSLLQNKVSAWLLNQMAASEEAEFLVILSGKPDLSAAQSIESKPERSRFVRDSLYTTAQSTQAPLIGWLTERGLTHRSFYIVNAVLVKANRAVLETIAARPEVLRIEGNPVIHNTAPQQPLSYFVTNHAESPDQTTSIEPGISYVRAPEVWALGYTGQGIVIGSADTGVEWDHPVLKNHYRGWNGTSVNHDTNWHDSIHTGGGVCGPDAKMPCDDSNHGSHTTGTALGDDGQGNQTGMAPGAKFIACRNMDQGDGTPARYIECMEFFLAPYPVNGTPAQGDATKAPDVTINSWGCPPSEGCAPNTLKQAIEAQRAAGIMTVVAAGNAGPGCSSVNDPPGLYDASYTIGAFNATNGAIAGFSSRGPITLDSSNRLKPDITAPGVSVRSSVRGASYSFFSGTSMATPHVAGAVALLWSAVPSLRRQMDLTESILNESAVKVTASACDTSQTVPNNTWGFGRLDIKAAVDLARSRTLASVSAASYNTSELARESIVAAFGTNLATATSAAATLPLPTVLGGTTVKVRGSDGIERLAPLFFVSPTQINYEIPPDTPNGAASIIITNGNNLASTGMTMIASVAPGVFTANASGNGPAAAVALRFRNGQQLPAESVFQFDGSQYVSRPIDLGPIGDDVFLVLFGTGFRFRSGLSEVSAKIGGVDSEVTYAGAQNDFVSLDQLNIRLPRTLAGRGEVDVVLQINGKPGNTVKVSIK